MPSNDASVYPVVKVISGGKKHKIRNGAWGEREQDWLLS